MPGNTTQTPNTTGGGSSFSGNSLVSPTGNTATGSSVEAIAMVLASYKVSQDDKKKREEKREHGKAVKARNDHGQYKKRDQRPLKINKELIDTTKEFNELKDIYIENTTIGFNATKECFSHALQESSFSKTQKKELEAIFNRSVGNIKSKLNRDIGLSDNLENLNEQNIQLKRSMEYSEQHEKLRNDAIKHALRRGHGRTFEVAKRDLHMILTAMDDITTAISVDDAAEALATRRNDLEDKNLKKALADRYQCSDVKDLQTNPPPVSFVQQCIISGQPVGPCLENAGYTVSFECVHSDGSSELKKAPYISALSASALENYPGTEENLVNMEGIFFNDCFSKKFGTIRYFSFKNAMFYASNLGEEWENCDFESSIVVNSGSREFRVSFYKCNIKNFDCSEAVNFSKGLLYRDCITSSTAPHKLPKNILGGFQIDSMDQEPKNIYLAFPGDNIVVTGNKIYHHNVIVTEGSGVFRGTESVYSTLSEEIEVESLDDDELCPVVLTFGNNMGTAGSPYLPGPCVESHNIAQTNTNKACGTLNVDNTLNPDYVCVRPTPPSPSPFSTGEPSPSPAPGSSSQTPTPTSGPSPSPFSTGEPSPSPAPGSSLPPSSTSSPSTAAPSSTSSPSTAAPSSTSTPSSPPPPPPCNQKKEDEKRTQREILGTIGATIALAGAGAVVGAVAQNQELEDENENESHEVVNNAHDDVREVVPWYENDNNVNFILAAGVFLFAAGFGLTLYAWLGLRPKDDCDNKCEIFGVPCLVPAVIAGGAGLAALMTVLMIKQRAIANQLTQLRNRGDERRLNDTDNDVIDYSSRSCLGMITAVLPCLRGDEEGGEEREPLLTKEQREEAERQEAERQEAAREAERQAAAREAERQAAAREAERQEAAREAERQEAAREAERQEAVRQEAAERQHQDTVPPAGSVVDPQVGEGVDPSTRGSDHSPLSSSSSPQTLYAASPSSSTERNDVPTTTVTGSPLRNASEAPSSQIAAGLPSSSSDVPSSSESSSSSTAVSSSYYSSSSFMPPPPVGGRKPAAFQPVPLFRGQGTNNRVAPVEEEAAAGSSSSSFQFGGPNPFASRQ